MAVTIGTNIASLRGQRSLAEAQSRLSSAHERLSSGQRINRAADDAAGLAISSKLNTDARVYNRAQLNANDAISVLNIADSAVSALSAIVTRLKELASQAASGVLGTKQRAALDAEADALVQEYNRISATTAFNGQKLIEDESEFQFQLGYTTLGVSMGEGLQTSVAGTGTFTYNALIPVNYANSGTIVDIDNDGDLDIINATSGGGSLYAYLNDGSGNFTSTVTTAGGGGNTAIAGYINDDNFLDIMVPNGTANLEVYLGDGDGSFQAVRLVAVGAGTTSATLADMDQDGNLDIVAISGSEQQVYIRRGNGDGTFQAATTFSSGARNDVAVADVNHDGYPDVFTGASGWGGTSVALNDQSGGLLAFSGLDAVSAGDPVELTFGDFDSDGNVDFIFGGDKGAETFAVVRFGNGDGTFQTATLYSGGYNLAIADFNNDGYDDFLAETTIFLSNGDRTFTSSTVLPSFPWTGQDYQAGDLNGDGAPDVVGFYGETIGNGGGLYVYFNNVEASGGLAPISLLSAEAARTALDDLETTERAINNERSRIGANMNRLAVSLRTLNTSEQEIRSAKSRIMDVDYAEEVRDMTVSSILRDVGAAILAQANQLPQLAVALLKV